MNNRTKCSDEIDRAAIDQIFASTLQISNQCFEYKKLCVTVLGVIVAALLNIDKPTSFTSIAIIVMVIGIGFWLCDSIAYFYQKKNRSVMDRITHKIQDRHLIECVDEPSKPVSWYMAIFNASMALYMYISICCIIVLCFDNWPTLTACFIK
nr:hypothetical protein BCU37_20615 [Vibrio splendidus]PMJ93373.1 hypothetical protein BCU10_10520 [Vibrio splendidus]PMK54397.1 hypothetical protein BCT96_08240 [Vibrio splendidus]